MFNKLKIGVYEKVSCDNGVSSWLWFDIMR